MKVECIKNKLTDAVRKTERVVNKNNNLPVLSCLLLRASGGVFSVIGTNLDLGIQTEFSTRVFSEGVVAVPAHVLSGFLSQLPGEGVVVLEEVGGGLLISTKHTTTTIQTLNPNDFPSIPVVGGGPQVLLPAPDVVRGFEAVWYGSATSSMKPELSSVCVYTDHNEVVFVATDSFRLAEKRIPIKKNIELPTLLIPFKNVVDIMKVFEGVRDNIILSINKNQISLQGGGLRVTSRVIDGTFPDYQQIIPKSFDTEVLLLKQDLSAALRVSAVFSGAFHQVGFRAAPAKKTFEVTAENGQIGKNTMLLDASVKGEEVEVGFNQRYLTDCFPAITTDSVTLGFNGPHKALVLKGAGDRSFTYLVMPVNK